MRRHAEGTDVVSADQLGIITGWSPLSYPPGLDHHYRLVPSLSPAWSGSEEAEHHQFPPLITDVVLAADRRLGRGEASAAGSNNLTTNLNPTQTLKQPTTQYPPPTNQ